MTKKASKTKVKASIELLKVELANFLKANPDCHLKEHDGDIVIANPWGDDTVPLRVDTKSEALISALNCLVLPPRLTALWHKDTGDVEVIYTPFTVDSDFTKRAFEFRLAGNTYRCEFAKASERLLLLASAFTPGSPPSMTDYRNLQAFRYYVRTKDQDAKRKSKLFGEPLSFWLRKVPAAECDLVDLCRHVNFYMTHFDRQSPHILIHEAEPSGSAKAKRLRYPAKAFPEVIAARQLDPYLLGLWESARDAADPFRRFIYLYQILEYAAFYYLQEKILNRVKRVLASPDTPSCIDKSAHEILDSLIEDRMSDEAKIVALIESVSDPEEIWQELEPGLDGFAKETSFDGGFKLPPLVKAEWKKEDFVAAWTPKLPDALRKIRNALVHSREARMVNVIAPTRKNNIILRSWIHPLQIIAYHTLVYREI